MDLADSHAPTGRDTRDPSGLDALATLSRGELVTLWRDAYGCTPPKGVSRYLLVRVAAHHHQAHQAPLVVAKLNRRLALLKARAPGASKPRKTLRPGTRLVREWNGVTHVVDIEADGYVWNGRSYRSLSAVARAITGARWSGPRFFRV